MKRLLLLLNLGLACGTMTSSAAPYNSNLLSNPGAESGDLSGWTISLSGGNGFAAGWDGLVHSGEYSVATSYQWSTRYQTIDLLAAGFTAEELDAQPEIVFSDWLATRFDAGGRYALTFSLLDATGNASEPLASFSIGTLASPVTIDQNTSWFEETHTFNTYGTGLRYVHLEESGMSTVAWGGHYGTHFDDASVRLVQAVPEPTSNSLLLGGGLLLLLMKFRKQSNA